MVHPLPSHICMPVHKPAHICVIHVYVCIIMRYVLCVYYIIHDAYVQVSRMMCLDVHISRHDHLDDMYMSMMNLDENLVHNLVDNT